MPELVAACSRNSPILTASARLADLLDVVSFTTSSIVHFCDDSSVLEGLEALLSMKRTARCFIGDKPRRVQGIRPQSKRASDQHTRSKTKTKAKVAEQGTASLVHRAASDEDRPRPLDIDMQGECFPSLEGRHRR
jgi:hypothetical protein